MLDRIGEFSAAAGLPDELLDRSLLRLDNPATIVLPLCDIDYIDGRNS